VLDTIQALADAAKMMAMFDWRNMQLGAVRLQTTEPGLHVLMVRMHHVHALIDMPQIGNTAEFWIKAQAAIDLWDVNQAIKADLDQIKPLVPA